MLRHSQSHILRLKSEQRYFLLLSHYTSVLVEEEEGWGRYSSMKLLSSFMYKTKPMDQFL
jgi:hypothetical protein